MASADILTNIANSLLPVQSLITGGAYLMGIAFAMKALVTLKQHGGQQASQASGSSIKEPMIYFIVAGMMIYFPTGFDVLMNTTFGYSTVLSYSDMSTSSSWFDGNSQVGEALTVIIHTLGVYAFVKGWILIARAASSGQPPGGTGKGLTHVFGGILAVNIVGTLEMISNTLTGA